MNKLLQPLPGVRDLRDRVLRRYSDSAEVSLESFARNNALPWPATLKLVTKNELPQKLRDAIMRMERAG